MSRAFVALSGLKKGSGSGRAALVLTGMWVLGLLALGAVIQFERRLDGARHAQVVIARMHIEQGTVLQVAFAPATAEAGNMPAQALTKKRLKEAKGALNDSIATLAGIGHSAAPVRITRLTRTYFRLVDHLSALVSKNNSRLAAVELGKADEPQGTAGRLTAELTRADVSYGADAAHSKKVASIGTVISIGFLLIAFTIAFLRSFRARTRSHHDASTDALTGLGNRRKLFADMDRKIRLLGPRETVSVGIFDLDGFKAYNDTFGHPAGDALLSRLGGRLAATVGGHGNAYRIGGDEFVVITSEPDPETLLSAAKNSLSEHGDRFAVGCSLGSTKILAGITLEEALRVADQRLYTDKRSSRRNEDGQAHDVLLSVLAERSDMLATHVSNVGRLAAAVGRRLSLTDDEVALVKLTAELHDIGKTAIPDAILNKPGPLNDDEWSFIRRHTVIGERILAAAPALERIAALVRSTHERFDGTGYPDRLDHEEIPLTARIVAVVDAYDAMTSSRPYRATLSPDEAIAELRRCAGTQFDPAVTDAFIDVCRQLAEQAPVAVSADSHTPLAA